MKFQVILIFLPICLLLVPCTIRTSTVKASSETTVEVVPQTSSADLGQTFTINVTVMDVQNLYGVEVTVNWNSSILELMNVDIRLGYADGVLYNTINLVENSSYVDQYAVSAYSNPPASPFNGSGNIVRMTFKVTSLGYSSIDLEATLYDYPPPDREPPVSLPIQHATIGGYFSTVIPEIPVPVVFLAFMIPTILALIFSKMPRKHALADQPL